ncbi:hypothetical protein F4780DRAFT_770595 [Xylariomycetidae sp. FL0641]|nr:hypothetical protein F4780DRAFT_770595 [Xylariomycetidae sp. FL0641]
MEARNSSSVSSLYRPLEDGLPLRILRLLPGPGGAPIETELFATTLDDVENRFEAISYAWGSQSTLLEIRCNDIALPIGQNAFNALRWLRLPDRPRDLWMDAVCIHQDDLDERSAQVSIMHHIYARAERVVVDLGLPDQHSDVAMEYVATLDPHKFESEGNISSSVQHLEEHKSYFFSPSFDVGVGFVKNDLEISIVSLLQRQWFCRVWVQQETSLARTLSVICGSKRAAWEQIYSLGWIMDAVGAAGVWPRIVPQYLPSIEHATWALCLINQRRQWIETFPTLMNRVEGLQATDPRDMVYAMKNLADEVAPWFQWFKPDYRVPWQVLFTQVGSRLLMHRHLDFLHYAGLSRHGADTLLPSWAPDWHVLTSKPVNTVDMMNSYDAGGYSGGHLSAKFPWARKMRWLPKHYRRNLLARGREEGLTKAQQFQLQVYAEFDCIMADEIVYVGELENEVLGRSIADIIRQDEQRLEDLGLYINQERILDAYRLTLSAGCDHIQRPAKAEYMGGAPLLTGAFELSRVWNTYRFAITYHGYLCLVPSCTKVRDMVGVFTGVDCGVVLRRWTPPARAGQTPGLGARTDQEGQYHEFVGEAYIHGMMRNEAKFIMYEFDCKHRPTEVQRANTTAMSDKGRGYGWTTADLPGGYDKILPTL